MSLPERIRQSLGLPAFCAPMFKVSSPELVAEACRAGIIGGLPRHNAASAEQFEAWLKQIATVRQQAKDQGLPAGILAVNLTASSGAESLNEDIALCRKYGCDIIVNATGNPAHLTQRVHDAGLLLFADVVNMRFAEKAVEASVDGIIAIGAGGGGHSGTLSQFVLVPRIREIYDGVIVMAGCVNNGASIRAAEVLGADLAYLGTRFIATQESAAPDTYKSMLITGQAKDLVYSSRISGISANWLKHSLIEAGLDPAHLPKPDAEIKYGYGHLPESARPWTNLWSAGQGIELIQDIPTVAALVTRLRQEYQQALAIKPFTCAR